MFIIFPTVLLMISPLYWGSSSSLRWSRRNPSSNSSPLKSIYGQYTVNRTAHDVPRSPLVPKCWLEAYFTQASVITFFFPNSSETCTVRFLAIPIINFWNRCSQLPIRFPRSSLCDYTLLITNVTNSSFKNHICIYICIYCLITSLIWLFHSTATLESGCKLQQQP